MEAWEKVYVGDAGFLASIHNLQNCISCHGGVDGEMDKDLAHEAMASDPTSDPDKVCAGCHSTEVEMASTGLHQTLAGYRTTLEQRGADFSDPHMQEAFDNHCYTCHTTCGQCHISRPNFTNGGLIAGHKVKEIASIADTCMACHGARVANEYRGKNEGVPGSVHWLEGGMPCFECHDISEYHGDGTDMTGAHRYDGEASPNCIDCHPEAAPGETDVLEHALHWSQVACSVCHTSGPYKNCYSCHVGTDEKGLPYFETEESQMQFKIGRNPFQSEERPWEYVLVRHVPVEPDTFAFYGDALLSSFDNLPTWKYATPHNIQRITPQNATCDNCHGNAELFLTADDVDPARQQANASVIVEKIPSTATIHIVPQAYDPQACTECHPNAVERDWGLSNENIHTLYHLVEPAGKAIACEDCHAPGGSFDWAAAGYSTEEAAKFVWSEYPDIKQRVDPTSNPIWMLGIGLVIVLAAGAPLALRRKEDE